MIRVPSAEIAGRLAAFQALLARSQVDAALVRQNTDLYYFTGTVQDGHLIVPASGRPVFLVRRHAGRAMEESPLRPVTPMKSMKELPPAVFEACGSDELQTLGLELDVLPASTFFFYDEQLFPKQRIMDISGLVRRLRAIKSPWELEMMRGAAAISAKVAEAVPFLLKEGISELELAAELEAVARKNGHLGFSRVRAFNMEVFFGHVLSGPEAATSSYTDAPTGGPGISPAFGQGPGERRIRRGDMVSVDVMTNHQGYLNDQTRNFSLGPPSPRLREAYELARELHGRLQETAKPGAVAGELYDRTWEFVRKAGWEDVFMGVEDARVSFVAHGLGLEVDELPFIARGQTMELREGMTFAFEPKFIVPGEGIAGLENTYAVTSDGLESLNTASEDLIVLD